MTRKSDWLQELTSLIAQPEGRGDVADTREAILRLIGDVLTATDWVACLWLGERRPNRNILTLWHVTTAEALPKPPSDRLYCIRSFPKNLVWPGRYGPAKDIAAAQQAAASLYGIGLDNQPRLRDCIHDVLYPEPLVPDFPSELLLPLFGPDSHSARSDGDLTPIGVLQIVTLKSLWPLTTESTKQVDQLMVLARGLAGRVTFSRTWRCINALESFQSEVNETSNSQEVCKLAVDVLCRMTHAVQCIMFRGFEEDGLKSFAGAAEDFQADWDPDKTGIIPASALVSHVFDRRIKSGEQSAIRLLDVYDGEELFSVFPEDTVLDDRYLSAQKKVCGCVSWMAVRIDARGQGLDLRKQAPLAVLKLSTVPRPHYIGGAFSETDERITRLIASYLGELLPSLFFRQFVQTLAPVLRYSPVEPEISELRKEDDAKILKRLRAAVPTIRWAWDIERRQAVEVRASASACQQNPGAPDRDLANILGTIHDSEIIEHEGRFYFSVSVLKIPTRERRLLVELSRPGLGEHEVSMIEHVAGEIRLRQLGDVDVELQLRNIVQIRHSLRHGLTGAIGHVAAARDTLETSRTLSPDRASKYLLNGARLRKLLEAAAQCAEEVSSLFEGARLLLDKIETTDLQLAPCDIAEVIRTIERNLQAEIGRRVLEVKIIDRYGRGLPRPTADRRLLRIALFNIFENAIKYSHRGQSIEITLYQQSDRWYCSFEDIGRYIPKSEKRSIFENSHRLKPDRGVQMMPGTGLGLPISLMIARAHHPSAGIDICSEPVKHSDGKVVRARTTFILHMPREIRGGSS